MDLFNDSRGLVRAIKCLKKKQILTMMPDVFDLSGQSISIPFFGHFTTAMAGTAFLALKTNALIMQAYCVPDNHGGVKCILHKPFQFPKSNDAEKDVAIKISARALDLSSTIRWPIRFTST